jgi:hypothetical protein
MTKLTFIVIGITFVLLLGFALTGCGGETICPPGQHAESRFQYFMPTGKSLVPIYETVCVND